MFKSANTIGALPTLVDVNTSIELSNHVSLRSSSQSPSWLPVDFAGRGIVEVLLNPSASKSAVYHIVNPNTSASWDDILNGLEYAGLKFERLEPMEWVERLAQSDQDGVRNPTIKLLVSFALLVLSLFLLNATSHFSGRDIVVDTATLWFSSPKRLRLPRSVSTLHPH